jgi:hypothetical protein
MPLSRNEIVVGCIMSVTYVVLLFTCSGMLLDVYVKAAETEKNVAQAVMAGMSITLLSIMIPTLILYLCSIYNIVDMHSFYSKIVEMRKKPSTAV